MPSVRSLEHPRHGGAVSTGVKTVSCFFLSRLPMFVLVALLLVSLASADTVYVSERVQDLTLEWEANETWTTVDGNASSVPGPNDNVVFLRDVCTQNVGFLLLTTEVTVRSVSIMAKDGRQCVSSLVVDSGGWLHTQSFSAGAGAQLFLSEGSISAPVLLFDQGAMLGGSGAIQGEVVMRGDSFLLAGEASRGSARDG